MSAPDATEHAVAIAGGGPTGLMLAAQLALAGIDVVIVERRTSQHAAPNAVSIRPDGHVAWVGESSDEGLSDALTTCFGPPA